ncbi:MAG: lycopene beta-cyclase CrtY [Pseudomonadota bacterium]
MKTDIAIAGGGLAGSLIAWRLAVKRPDVAVTLVERGDRLGGNHTWSFHETDLPTERAAWLDPLVVYSWANQEVRFANHARKLRTGYRSATSDRLHDTVAPLLGERARFGADIDRVDKDAITLADGERIEAHAVIDARGQRRTEALTIGFQKFLGQEIRFKQPHGVTTPIIMDATISQTDGYRFIYVLPFSDDVALIEDTYYADGDAMQLDGIRQEIADYCTGRGWDIAAIEREEVGVLPIALAGDIDAHLNASPPGVAQAGLRAGLFHPLTGYSLPDAALLADLIADAPDLSGAALYALTRTHAERRWRARAFYRLLSRLLYYAARPEGRHKVLARFYRLGEPLIERFYASGSTRQDKMRVLVGKPPVSFFKAVECVAEDWWLEERWKPHAARMAAE